MSGNHTYDPELALLGPDDETENSHPTDADIHRLQNAPLLTGDVLKCLGPDYFPQRAVYGRVLETSTGGKLTSPKLYINANAPFSGIICGVQGSGKSHSTAVLLESCLIKDNRLGSLPSPLSSLVFHFDMAAGSGDVAPCEAAYLASLKDDLAGNASAPFVTVMVLPNCVPAMKRVYGKLPNVEVKPLYFSPKDINGERLLSMMKVDADHQMPLYMECIMTILRSMTEFSYTMFRETLAQQKFSASQKSMLNLRLAVLDSCLQGGTTKNRISGHFKRGNLTIVDLSSPFMDASSACGLFDIILGVFIETRAEGVGKLIVLDEAHKYLTNSGGASRLTDSLLSVVRQQRHLGTRVLISTQEPTVVPSKFLDLCSFIIAHRFSSPKWIDHIKEHVSTSDAHWSTKVMELRTGEAIIFAPSGLVMKNQSSESQTDDTCVPLARGYLRVRSRLRITKDGGCSVLAIKAKF